MNGDGGQMLLRPGFGEHNKAHIQFKTGIVI